MQKKNTYKIISISLKAFIAVLSIGYIYQKISLSPSTISSNLFSKIFSSSSIIVLIFVFILMFLNWSLEAIKWRILISRIEKISFSDSLKAVFSGITISIFSPNRTGEFIGRIFFLQKADRREATLLTFAGNAVQLAITFFMPVVSFVVFRVWGGEIPYKDKDGWEHFDEILFSCTLAVLLCFIGLLILFFVVRYFFYGMNNKYIDILRKIPLRQLGIIVFLSLIRYGIFSLQYCVLLVLFDVHLTLTSALIVIPLTFLATSTIPTFFLTEIGIRGAAALFFIGIISNNDEGILAASLMLWLINLAIPALLGVRTVFRLTFFRK